jgi:putative ATPase
MNLFAEESARGRPLAERLRPKTLDEYVGQEHILGPGKPLRLRIEKDQLGSMILWGPPGVGKTTLGNLIANATKSDFVPFSAVMSGIKEIKAVMVDAERNRHMGRRTVIFVDEIHRFNKAQGRVPALCRTRRHRADRRDHRESIIRSSRRLVVAVEGLHSARIDA